tara:strand:+ start:793 stop:1209 length:417 start_codon:yes stop_codon:yes gene_type:complete
MKFLLENWRQYLEDDSENIDIEVEGGSLSGVVHNDIQRVLNWAEKERTSRGTIETIGTLKTPIAILKNMHVEEESKNQGIGTDLLQQFLDKTYNMPILLISDEGEENAFGLTNWYEKYGFEHIGESGGYPVLLKRVEK